MNNTKLGAFQLGPLPNSKKRELRFSIEMKIDLNGCLTVSGTCEQDSSIHNLVVLRKGGNYTEDEVELMKFKTQKVWRED